MQAAAAGPHTILVCGVRTARCRARAREISLSALSEPSESISTSHRQPVDRASILDTHGSSHVGRSCRSDVRDASDLSSFSSITNMGQYLRRDGGTANRNGTDTAWAGRAAHGQHEVDGTWKARGGWYGGVARGGWHGGVARGGWHGVDGTVEWHEDGRYWRMFGTDVCLTFDKLRHSPSSDAYLSSIRRLCWSPWPAARPALTLPSLPSHSHRAAGASPTGTLDRQSGSPESERRRPGRSSRRRRLVPRPLTSPHWAVLGGGADCGGQTGQWWSWRGEGASAVGTPITTVTGGWKSGR